MRATDAVRLAVGVPLTMRPDLPARVLGLPPTEGLVLVTRALGIRYAVQGLTSAALTATSWRRRALVADAAVDGAHAASMLPVAVLLPPIAPAALLSGAVAATLALLDGRAARRPSRRQSRDKSAAEAAA
ncbi:hypothetical protein GCM10009798_10560 [Nocardioides panacihumi]|uniref:Uncharacterized protein n=1 Tax=Nocardioides panacihumi TaxID=400774 RepID=A0ABN2QLC0_9ACTN